MISNGTYRKDRGIADTGIRMPLFHSLVEKSNFWKLLFGVYGLLQLVMLIPCSASSIVQLSSLG